MTLQHSPGPWTIDTSASSDYVFDADSAAVCKMVFDWSDDARLIAAAPDMLRLLRVLCDGLDEYWESQNTAVVAEARALIARLDGDTCPEN